MRRDARHAVGCGLSHVLHAVIVNDLAICWLKFRVAGFWPVLGDYVWSERVRGSRKLPNDFSSGRKGAFALSLDSSLLSYGRMAPSPARSAACRILRDPFKSKASMIAAELALGPRPKR